MVQVEGDFCCPADFLRTGDHRIFVDEGVLDDRVLPDAGGREDDRVLNTGAFGDLDAAIESLTSLFSP